MGKEVVACGSWVMVLAGCFAVLGVQWGCCRSHPGRTLVRHCDL